MADVRCGPKIIVFPGGRARSGLYKGAFVALGISVFPITGSAQDDAEDASNQLQRVIVTGTAVPVTRLRSSASVSTLDREQLQQSGADSAADALRSMPGVLAQSSGGEGNANLGARGLPLSGGAKFLNLQEDGLPVLAFGDIDFATADTFVRTDLTLDRIELIRGGPASTFASNAPGGVVNFISQTGEVAGGEVRLTQGVDFRRTRVDFAYGRPIDPDWRFHMGGFFRTGEGPRTLGYTAEHGGQFKGNLTRRLGGDDYLRLYVKLLDDRAPVYLPVPASITGSAADPHVASLPGFDLRTGALQTPQWPDDLSVDRNGQVVRTGLRDGYRSVEHALGLEAAIDLGAGWRFEGRGRAASLSGRFVGPYPAEVGAASTLAEEIGGPGATLRYATGPRAGSTVTDPAQLAGNGLALRTHLFNVTLNNLDHQVADLRLTRTFTGSGQWLGATFGLYSSRQTIDEDWHWNTYLQEVRGNDAALLDVVRADGTLATQRGLVAYGEPYWGNCCVRSYRLRYDTDAPYVALHWQRQALDLDASVRQDIARASGSYAGARIVPMDVNGDGVLQAPETQVPVVDASTRLPVDYTVRYLSYSLGANLLATRDAAVFVRASRGGRANAERVLFGGGIRSDGGIAKPVAVDIVTQQEIGIKGRGLGAMLSATLFHASTRVTDQDITSQTQRYVSRVYRAHGLELEGTWEYRWFGLRAGLTFTDSRIASDQITPAQAGQQVGPRCMYAVAPALHLARLDAGLNLIGSSRFPSTRTGIQNPGFVQVNAFASYAVRHDLTVSLVGNNIFNRVGITEIANADAGITASGVNTARSIAGRTLQLQLTYAL